MIFLSCSLQHCSVLSCLEDTLTNQHAVSTSHHHQWLLGHWQDHVAHQHLEEHCWVKGIYFLPPVSLLLFSMSIVQIFHKIPIPCRVSPWPCLCTSTARKRCPGCSWTCMFVLCPTCGVFVMSLKNCGGLVSLRAKEMKQLISSSSECCACARGVVYSDCCTVC